MTAGDRHTLNQGVPGKHHAGFLSAGLVGSQSTVLDMDIAYCSETVVTDLQRITLDVLHGQVFEQEILTMVDKGEIAQPNWESPTAIKGQVPDYQIALGIALARLFEVEELVIGVGNDNPISRFPFNDK